MRINGAEIVRCAICEKGRTPARIVATLEISHCCLFCALEHNGPGKFEAHAVMSIPEDELSDPETDWLEDLGKCLILYHWSLEGGEDDFMSSEGYGYCGRFGQYLLFQDDRGSVSFEDCRTEVGAQKRFIELYSNGMGASEDDAYISEDRNGYYVTFEGKDIGTFERLSRAKAAVSLEMRKSGFFPNVWLCGERGNISNVGVW